MTTEEGVIMVKDTQATLLTGGVWLLLSISILFLLLFLSAQLLPKDVSLYGTLMSAALALVFEWERRVRRGKVS